jgi:hypothetical protein
MLDALLRHPLFRKALTAGEEGAGRAISLLLSRLPSSGDLKELERRLAEIEAALDGLAARLDGSGGEDPKR